ncbi:hypothetical protein [Erwinia aphidicola]|uniref:hypothetical protein n=1 Tax=Erwinia aphidicola TaxID=68334 RepID=UPI00301688EA
MTNTLHLQHREYSSQLLMCCMKWACEYEFAERNVRSAVLRLVTDIRDDRHASGYPKPEEISLLTFFVRQEKFRLVRERGRDDEGVAEIQRLLDGLKQFEAGARLARPATDIPVTEMRRPWFTEWAGWAGLVLMSPVFMCILIWLPPGRGSVIALSAYALLTQAAKSFGRDKFSHHYAAMTWGILALTCAGMVLHHG